MESITNTVLTDMAGAFIEHSAMITNFVAVVYSQLINSVCRVFPHTVQYKCDRGEKMELYRQQEVDEYWIADWRKRQVEIYTLDYDEKQEPRYYLWKTITEENKEELRLVRFPNIKITFDELFAKVDLE